MNIETDLTYALKQLRGIDLKTLEGACPRAFDRVQRALDALTRIENGLKHEAAEADDETTAAMESTDFENIN